MELLEGSGGILGIGRLAKHENELVVLDKVDDIKCVWMTPYHVYIKITLRIKDQSIDIQDPTKQPTCRPNQPHLSHLLHHHHQQSAT